MAKQICPKCKSTDIQKDFSVQSYGQGSFFNQYKCNKCGYTGQFFPIIKKKKTIKKRTKAKAFRAKAKKKFSK